MPTRELQKAQREARALEAISVKTRKEENTARTALLNIKADTNSRKKAIILRNQRKSEEAARVHSQLRSYRASKAQSGLNRLEVPLDPSTDPKKCTIWRTVTDPPEIVSLLRQRNQSHFGQAQGTPPAKYPLSEELDFTASTHTSELMLEGNYSHEDLDAVTQMLVNNFKRFSNPVKDTSLLLTEDDFISKIRCWKETDNQHFPF